MMLETLLVSPRSLAVRTPSLFRPLPRTHTHTHSHARPNTRTLDKLLRVWDRLPDAPVPVGCDRIAARKALEVELEPSVLAHSQSERLVRSR